MTATDASAGDFSDFTEDGYRSLIRSVRQSYRVGSYRELPLAGPVALLRHDCDVSLNRALRLARIEAEEGVASTFFLLPHSPFYNLLERSQADIVHAILGLGHEIGLHFDAGFYTIADEAALDRLVAREADWLRQWFGAELAAFSFHNPGLFELSCEKDSYGGLVNCYSRWFKDHARYGSDSNGYWRHRRMFDLVGDPATGPIQLLTHPEWWQEAPMPPRQRIVRAAEGRARATLEDYDRILREGGRVNVGASDTAGPLVRLRAVRRSDSAQLYEWINDRALRVLNAAYQPVSEVEHERWMESIFRPRDDLVVFMIDDSETGATIGSCQLLNISRLHRTAELQIRIGVPQAQGRGRGTAAVEALCRFGATDLGLRRIYLDVFATNTRAIRAYERARFEREGLKRAAAFVDGTVLDVVTMAWLNPDA